MPYIAGVVYLPVPDGKGGYDRVPCRSKNELYTWLNTYANSDDAFIQKFIQTNISGNGGFADAYNQWKQDQQALQDIQSGKNPTEIQAGYVGSGLTPSQDMTDLLGNAQSNYNTQQAQDYSTWQMNNQFLSAGSQLSALGLSPSSVVQTGGAVGNAVGAANAFKGNAASLKHQATINRYNQQMGLAKSLIGAAGSMASSGIYGAALGAVKHSAQAVASTAAHSGLKAIKATKVMSHYNGYGNKGFDVDENGLLKI